MLKPNSEAKQKLDRKREVAGAKREKQSKNPEVRRGTGDGKGKGGVWAKKKS